MEELVTYGPLSLYDSLLVTDLICNVILKRIESATCAFEKSVSEINSS